MWKQHMFTMLQRPLGIVEMLQEVAVLMADMTFPAAKVHLEFDRGKILKIQA
jgi:hypothetical protein